MCLLVVGWNAHGSGKQDLSRGYYREVGFIGQ
jgi:hypothetical protein